MHLLAGQKRLEDEYEDPDVILKVNKADMAGTMESIEEYLQSQLSHKSTSCMHQKENHDSPSLW